MKESRSSRQAMYLDGEYLQKNPNWHIEDSPWKAEQILLLLDSVDSHPTTVAEVGCGAGEILSQIANARSDISKLVGYEISPHAYELCETRSSERVRCVLGDIGDSGTFVYDLVMVIDVIEHVDDYRQFLRRIRAAGTSFVFSIPMDFNVYTSLRHSSLERGREAMGHIHHFNRSTAISSLREAGFEIVSERYISAWSDSRMRRYPSISSAALLTCRRVFWRLSPSLAIRTLGGGSLLVMARPVKEL